MKIAVDCRMLGSSGIGTYLEGCLPVLLDSPHNFLLLGSRQKLEACTDGKTNVITEELGINPFSPAEILGFPGSLIKKINQNDVYYSPYFNIPSGIIIPVFTTIHDMVFPDLPGLVSPAGLLIRMYFYRRAYRKSAGIFTVSEFSKQRIEHYLGTKKPVFNASNAVVIPSSDINSKTIKKKNIILFIGNIKKHKGLEILLDAFNSCIQNGLNYKLLIIGNKDNFRSKDFGIMARLEIINDKNIQFTGFISEGEKRKLLSEAALLVQPSLYEGFGYPPLEAMLSGTQALISDIPVFREVYNDFPVTFFNTGDSDDLKSKMMDLLHKKEPVPLKLPQFLAEKYSFKKTVSKILIELEKYAPVKGKS